MRLRLITAAALLVSSCAAAAPPTPPQPPIAIATETPRQIEQAKPISPVGDWHGNLSIPPATYRLGFHIEDAGAGQFKGTISSPDVSPLPAPLKDISFADGVLKFTNTTSGGGFTGRWDAATEMWTGDYVSGGRTSPIKFMSGPVPPLPPLPAVAGLDGRWEGKLQGVMPLVFRITTNDKGTVALMDSPSQNSTGFPVPSLKRDGQHVAVSIPALAITYEAELSSDSATLTGTFKQGAAQLPFVMSHVSAEAGEGKVAERPQTPKPPFPYKSEDVIFDNPASPGVKIACTLTEPSTGGPFPAALMITGSGAQDRDETLVGHKPFLVIADALTRKGIAILRCDDRGTAKSTGDFAKATLDDFMTDNEAAIAWLHTRSDIDPKRIGIIGHSEGGVTGPRVAAAHPDVAFLVMMAGLGVKGAILAVDQQQSLAKSSGATPEQLAKGGAIQKQIITAIAAAKDDASARATVLPLLLAIPMKQEQAESEADRVTSTYFRQLLNYDPATVLPKIKAPILAINGTKDVQVDYQHNLGGIRKLLAGRKNVTVIELLGLNHLFQTANTGAMDEYADISETIAPAALDAISSWLVKTVKP